LAERTKSQLRAIARGTGGAAAAAASHPRFPIALNLGPVATGQTFSASFDRRRRFVSPRYTGHLETGEPSIAG
jgi:hypothetical protein